MVCLVKSEKIVVDFCGTDVDKMLMTASSSSCNNGCDSHDISLYLNQTTAIELARYLESPLCSQIVVLDNNKCELRHIWNQVKIMNSDQSIHVGWVGVSSDKSGVKLSMQKHDDTTVVTSVRLTDADVRVLIGLLYFWISNQFISLRLVQNILEDKCLCVDNIEINNVCTTKARELVSSAG